MNRRASRRRWPALSLLMLVIVAAGGGVALRVIHRSVQGPSPRTVTTPALAAPFPDVQAPPDALLVPPASTAAQSAIRPSVAPMPGLPGVCTRGLASAAATAATASCLLSAFPSPPAVTQSLLARLNPILSPAFYAATEASWKATEQPRSRVTTVALSNVILVSQDRLIQEYLVTLTAQESPSPSEGTALDVVYSVYVVATPNGFQVLGVYPPGTLPDLREGAS